MNDDDTIISDDFIIPDEEKCFLEIQPVKVDYTVLNKAQMKAVETIDGPVLILAGAGTGKTTTMAYRVAYLLENNVLPENILLLTFTNSAAKSMKDKIENLLPLDAGYINKITACTFHSLAKELLERYCSELKPFSIIDNKDSEDIIEYFKNKVDIDFDNELFPEKEKLHSIFSKSSNRLISIEEIISLYYQDFIHVTGKILKIYDLYNGYKKDNNLLNFDDLLKILYEKLQKNSIFRELIQNRFKYILVDEYQDTNIIQDKIVKLISAKSRNLTVVGDDAQAIFSFIGTESRNILNFPNEYPDCKIIKLEHNYRSNQNILDLTNEFTGCFRYSFSKKLFSNIESATKPVVMISKSDDQEAINVLRKICRINYDEGPKFSYSNCAVLFRDTYHSIAIQAQLIKNKINYKLFGGKKFNEKKCVKDILAYLKIIYNPSDMISWTRVLTLIPGIGNKTAGKIIDSIINNKNTLNAKKFKNCKFYDDLAYLEFELKGFVYQDFNLYEAVEEICNYYRTVAGLTDEDYSTREKDINFLIDIIKHYNSLERFLGDFALNVSENPNETDNSSDMLILSTIHSAKGLEWKHVFVLRLIENYFPTSKSSDIEEEKRLFYVSCTRAKKSLCLSIPLEIRNRYFPKIQVSSFIKNISCEFYEIENHTGYTITTRK